MVDARKDRLCPGHNTDRPVVLVATGDSVTSAHLQTRYSAMMGACKGNTSEDQRGLPGNDMKFSYAGRYAFNLNRNVVEYYNFARTGMTTSDILGAGPDFKDACTNSWGRDSSPSQLAQRAIRQAKAEKKAAYFVSTGGINDTNWTSVLKALTICGTLDYYKELVQAYLTQHNIPFQPIMSWYDLAGNYAAKSRVIYGGACHLTLKGDGSGADYLHKRVDIPTYNGPDLYNAIKERVSDTIDEMLGAGADKVVWMGYYDISPAKLDFGAFAETYRQQVPEGMQKYLPAQIPWSERYLLDDPGWQAAIGQWTTQMNATLLAAIPDSPKARLAPPPGLGTSDIQKTGLGGCPHPNAAGHDKLANALAQTFN
jgi:lysophospholipase L1-like esterase